MLKYITKIQIRFTPFSNNSGSARYFLNYVSNDKALNSNPKCILKSEVCSNLDLPPLVQVEFKDGKKLTLKADTLKVKDIVNEVEKHTRKLALLDDSKN